MPTDDTAGRNISIENLFQSLGPAQKPRYRFAGTDRESFDKWQSELRPHVIASLGKPPEKVPLNPATISEITEDGLVKQRIILDVEPGLSAPALVYRPQNANGKFPAILCCHGHGLFGKDAVMGWHTTPAMEKEIADHNYDYGLQMAKAGFVTMAIDWRGFGERDDRRRGKDIAGSHRDICNMHFIRETILGRTLLGSDIHDGRCALDYLETLDFVDKEKIGVMGLSFGGTMTAWMALVDPRIKVADIICYSDRFPDFALKRGNFCGSQITPNLFDLCDVPDLQGLIAPRPLLVEIGKQDTTFLPESAMSCYHEVEKIYIAAGAHDKLALDSFDGPHAWGGNLSVRFFRRFLA